MNLRRAAHERSEHRCTPRRSRPPADHARSGRFANHARRLPRLVLSVVWWFTDSRQEALFTGLWVPSILALGGFYSELRRRFGMTALLLTARRDHLRHGGSWRMARAVRRGRARRPCRRASSRSGGGRRGAAEAFLELRPRSRNGLERHARARWGRGIGVLEAEAPRVECREVRQHLLRRQRLTFVPPDVPPAVRLGSRTGFPV